MRGEEREDGKSWVWGGAEKLTRDANPRQISYQQARRKGQSPSSVQEWTVAFVAQAITFPTWVPGPRPSPAAPGTHIWVSISEEFVEHVAELPAEHSIAGEGQPVDHRPKGLRPFLMVGAQYAW